MGGGDRGVVRVVATGVWCEGVATGVWCEGVATGVWCGWWRQRYGVSSGDRGTVWAVVWYEWWCGMGGGAGSVPPTPHLASPLKGGRDELGKGRDWGGGVDWGEGMNCGEKGVD